MLYKYFAKINSRQLSFCFVAGLDPASPLFENSEFAISKESDKSIDIIYTDARNFGNKIQNYFTCEI